jgi:hypothetical protein
MQYHLRDRHMITPSETSPVVRYEMQAHSASWEDVVPANAYYMCPNAWAESNPEIQAMILLDRREYFSIYRASASSVIKIITTK